MSQDNVGLCMLSHFSHVQICATIWIVAYKAPLSMESSRQDTGVGFQVLLQGILLAQGSNPGLPCLQAGSLPSVPPRKPHIYQRKPPS